VSRRKAKERHWLGLIVIFVAVPLVVWSVVFLGWLFWPDFAGRAVPAQISESKKTAGPPERKSDRRQDEQSTQRSRERIAEEERKKLNDIIERR
jgi:hypothetical protein